MTEQERLWFDKLRYESQQDWVTFSKPKYRGIFDSLVNKYNDTAHFLYELLQNADDAGATDVEINLERNRIIFIHNGSERFTISEIDNTEYDRAKGTLGHINSITAINYSTKVQFENELEHNKIGKFGIGFKAVFYYTTTPYIYDDGICFKIENYIIPTLLEDTSYARKGKTVFVLPFDQEKTKDRAYDEISKKLLRLEHPQLYLHNIKNIHWTTETDEGTLSQSILKEYDFNDIHAELLAMIGAGNKTTNILNVWRTVNIADKGSFRIALSYYLKGNAIDTTNKRKLYCFFPTDASIGTCYAIHAPFLLTESRQSLLPNEPVNKELFKEIARLAADSLIVLRDIGIEEQSFLLGDDIKKLTEVSVANLRDLDSLMEEDLFAKEYGIKFNTEALFLSSHKTYLNAKEACWAKKEILDLLSSEQLFKLMGKKEFVLCSCSNHLSEVKGLGIDELSIEQLASKISPAFLSEQRIEWIDRFYSFVNSNETKAKADNKVGAFHYCAIFKTEANTFAAAFERGNVKPLLCLYTEGIDLPSTTINQELLQQSEDFKSLIKTSEIETADRLNYIRMRLREQQEKWSQEEANAFWKIMIDYWTDCNDSEKNVLFHYLKQELRVRCYIIGIDNGGYADVTSVYLPSVRIVHYCGKAANAYWWYLDESTTYSPTIKENKFNDVLQKCILNIDYYQAVRNEVAGKFDEFINWLQISEYPKTISFEKGGQTYTTIDNVYRVVYFLGNIEPDSDKVKELVNELSHFVWEILNQYPIKNYVIGEYPELKRRKYSWHYSLTYFLYNEKWLFIDNKIVCPKDIYQDDAFRNGYEGIDLMNLLGIEKRKDYAEEALLQILPKELRYRINSDDAATIDIIKAWLSSITTSNDKEESDDAIDGNSLRTIEEISIEQLAEQTERYTFKWFKLLIDLEAKACGEPDEEKKRRALKVSFSSVVFPIEKDIVRLECASRYVPTSIEEIDDLEIAFCMVDGSQTKIKFDAVSVKDNVLSLKIKQRQKDEIEKLRQCKRNISHAEINCEQTIDLLHSWRRLIYSMPFNDSYSLKDNLHCNLRFIFGPPGTGKTYQLAKTIIDKMNNEHVQRILVLTPTNKACDVLTEKIMDLAPYSCPWLSRFAKTLSDRIDSEGVVLFRDTPLKDQTCLVTTISRYAYDSCNEGAIREMDWDIVVVDEASMIPLYQIIAPLYNERLHSIIVAGDPFQIQPIVRQPLWKDENIYTMLELHDFANPTTNPQGFKVETLTHQWRSIPEIGELYSRYAYNGLLTHNRKAEERIQLDMGIDAHSLNIVTFPIYKESTFATQRLKDSSIQVYSVIFTVELLKFVSENIAKNNSDKTVSIGVVCPYAAEVQAISKMYEQLGEHYENISVSFGTAHGFQGDDCNVMFAIMNPPASGLIKNAQNTHINNRNIINVSISRAKDYLFVIMPDCEYEHSDKLIELNKLQSILRGLGYKHFTNNDIERIIYGRKGVIAENAFVTSHQMTNVYSDFSKKYEVRIDDTSIDIQVNNKKLI